MDDINIPWNEIKWGLIKFAHGPIREYLPVRSRSGVHELPMMVKKCI